MAFDRLIERIAKLQNPTVAGLDPKLAYIPSYIKEDAFEKYGKIWTVRPQPFWNSIKG